MIPKHIQNSIGIQFLGCNHWSQVTTGCRLDDVLGQPFSWTPEGPEKDINLMCPWKQGDLYNVLGGVKGTSKTTV